MAWEEPQRTWGSSFKSCLRDPPSQGSWLKSWSIGFKGGRSSRCLCRPEARSSQFLDRWKWKCRVDKGFWTLLEMLANELGDGQPPSIKTPCPNQYTIALYCFTIHLVSKQTCFQDLLIWGGNYYCSVSFIQCEATNKQTDMTLDFEKERKIIWPILLPACHVVNENMKCIEGTWKKRNMKCIEADWRWFVSGLVSCCLFFYSPAPTWHIYSLSPHRDVNMFGLHWVECALRLPYEISWPFPCWFLSCPLLMLCILLYQ